MAAVDFSTLNILVFDQNFERAKLVRGLLDSIDIGETHATASHVSATDTMKSKSLSMAVINLESKGDQTGTAQFMDSIRDPKYGHATGLPVLGMMAEVTKENLMYAVHIGADFVIQRPFSVCLTSAPMGQIRLIA